MRELLLPDESPMTHRKSSIDQFGKYLSAYEKGGWCPIVFDQLDGITCDKVFSHPVVISWDPVGYVYPEGRCTYTSDYFITADEEGVKEMPLPECMGGHGEFYQKFVRANAFINFDDDTSLGVHNKTDLRVGLDYVQAVDTLPSVD